MRNSAKAIVFVDDTILLVRNRDRRGDFFLLPGGGQEFGETLHDALVRETAEETGLLVEPSRLVLIREYIGSNHEFAEEDGGVHQVELMFLATLRGEAEGVERVGDDMQTGAEWLPLARLKEARIYPSALADILPGLHDGSITEALYLGDVN